MTAFTNFDSTPRVWVACISCYASGRLVGDFFDAIDAAEVSLADVHGGVDDVRADCEELWCLDVEGIPVTGELGVLEAAEWGRVMDEVDEHLRPALCASVRSGAYTAEGHTDLPSISDFEDAYCGEWDSFGEYAEQLAEDIGLLAEVPEEIANYFDWKSWTRDLLFDYSTEAAAGGGVHVFRNY